MSQNTGRKPRHNPAGRYTHECAFCGVTFKDNRKATRYCSFDHKQQASNQRFYGRHRKEIILRVMLHRSRAGNNVKRAKRTAAPSKKKSSDVDTMSPD